MTDLEIPLEKDRKGHYRFFEILPGSLSYLLLLLPFILSFINVSLSVFFILFYLLIFFARAIGYSARAITGYITMKEHMKLDWQQLCEDLDNKSVGSTVIDRPKWHYKNINRLENRAYDLKPSELFHVVVIATVNESREVLEPTIQAIINSNYDIKKIILFIAYEGRAGKETERRVKELLDIYGQQFKYAEAVKHPSNIPNEVIGKGSNITYASKKLKKYIKKEKIDPKKVLVTTLDSDNRVDRRYFASLSYLYCVVPNPLRASYQPLAMYTNNIWDAPTMMRVLATGNNLYYIVGTKRPHLSRNFSAHAQPLQSLLDTNFWSTRTVV
ncbi:MAG TPA: hypothetical protein VLF63_02780, partial [Patescibacteria group bacterium]|nr:hypothetical protein [Patescibacteria group bacterium]